MPEYRYNVSDRLGQLAELELALRDLIPVAESIPAAAGHVGEYRVALGKIRELQEDGFTQEQLSALARSIPDVFHRHKDWVPPLTRTDTGNWVECDWYGLLESKLQPVLNLVTTLKQLGYY